MPLYWRFSQQSPQYLVLATAHEIPCAVLNRERNGADLGGTASGREARGQQLAYDWSGHCLHHAVEGTEDDLGESIPFARQDLTGARAVCCLSFHQRASGRGHFRGEFNEPASKS